jgi:hypothetical protein
VSQQGGGRKMKKLIKRSCVRNLEVTGITLRRKERLYTDKKIGLNNTKFEKEQIFKWL